MKHPHREEWIPYLFRETDPETKKRLAAHLNACPECAAELHGWRMSLQRLDAWKTPKAPRRMLPALSSGMALAAAAVLVLGLGFMGGRLFSASVDSRHVRAELVSSLKAALIPELRREMAGEIDRRIEKFDRDFSEAVAKAKAEAIEGSTSETAHALQQLIAAIRSDRAEDQQAAAGWVDDLRKQHDTDFVSLRKDLETVAALTDEQIRAARMKLIELTAVSPSDTHP
jgi:hypothetical protein